MNQELPIYSSCRNKFSNSSSSDDENESNNWFISIFANKIDAVTSILIFCSPKGAARLLIFRHHFWSPLFITKKKKN